ncbi:hypothetical protein CLE01_22690 [Cryobacterium levicorallinum]|nr:hypothetical protein CLE01_22690 [Cryobacterium levicorallinum]
MTYRDAKLTRGVTFRFTHSYDNQRTPPDLPRGPRDCRQDDGRHPRHPLLPNVPLTATFPLAFTA